MNGAVALSAVLFTSMFTVPSTLLCFHNLSSRNSRRKIYLAGLHKRTVDTRTHTHTLKHARRKQSLRQQSEGQRVTRDEVRAVMRAAHRRQDAEGSLVMGVKHEVLIRSPG